MTRARVPILLSYYALVNRGQALIFGQVTCRRMRDLTFTAYSPRTTFRTLVSLYRSRPLANESIVLHYGSLTFKATTDSYGFFMIKEEVHSEDLSLQNLTFNDQAVHIPDGLYERRMHHVYTDHIVVSDIDDTILHSHIPRKVRKLRTLMFTPVESRLAVEPVKELINRIVAQGSTPLYLSNSEQNLYPLIYRFLAQQGFPKGPLFLKQMRRLRDLIRYRKLPTPEVHKMKMLNILMPMFPEKSFILIGDNTQYDLSIYLAASKNYPNQVKAIYIRRVIPLPDEDVQINTVRSALEERTIRFHYGEDFAEQEVMNATR